MIISFGNWELTKSNYDIETESKVFVRMVANSLKKDKENDVILPQAFSKETVDYFLKNGIIDWNHMSMIGSTMEERARSILGKPEKFNWEDNKPVVYGYLTKTHPVVKESILPHLEADQKVFGASIGGFIKKSKIVFDKETNQNKRLIYEIEWNHIAIAPLPYAISSETQVEIVKSKGLDSNLIVKYPDILYFFNDFYNDKLISLKKALEVGYETDSMKIMNGDALRIQSIDNNVNEYMPIVYNLIDLISTGIIEPKAEKIIDYLEKNGYKYSNIEKIIENFIKILKEIKDKLKTITDRSVL